MWYLPRASLRWSQLSLEEVERNGGLAGFPYPTVRLGTTGDQPSCVLERGNLTPGRFPCRAAYRDHPNVTQLHQAKVRVTPGKSQEPAPW